MEQNIIGGFGQYMSHSGLLSVATQTHDSYYFSLFSWLIPEMLASVRVETLLKKEKKRKNIHRVDT